MANEKLQITVTAKADKAEQDLREIAGYADQLDAEQIDLIVRARTEQAERDLKQLHRQLARASDPVDVKVILEGIGRAEDQMRELGRLGESTTGSMSGLVDAAGMLPGPLGEAAGLLSGGGGVAAGAVAAGAAMFAVADSAADAAIDAEALRVATGGTVEETSRLLAATKSVGLDYNDLQEIISESNRAMTANADEAARLGVELEGTPIERFQQLADAVYRIPDPLERSRLASQFFGEEGSKQMGRLIASAGSLEDALGRVDSSQIMTDDDVAAAKEYEQTMAELKTQFAALATTIGQALLPVLTDVVGLVNDTADASRDMSEKADAMGESVNRNTNWLRSLGGAVGSLGGLLDNTGDSTTDLNEALYGTGDATDTLAGALTDRLAGAFGTVADGAGRVAELYAEQKAAAEDLVEATEALRDEQLSMADAAVEVERGAKDLSDAILKAGEDGAYTREELEGLHDQLIDNADAQVKVHGVTRESEVGSQIYNKALLQQARTMGNTLTPEMVGYMHAVEAIPDESVTAILAAINAGDWAEVDRLIREADEATPTPTIGATVATAGFDDAKRRADELDNRVVTVDVQANVAAASAAISRLAGQLAGITGRATQATAARYVWRNGRYVEI